MPFTPSIPTFAKLGLFAATLPIAAFAAGCNGAEGQPVAASPADSPSIVVVGHGEAHAKPDIAYINLGVEERGATVSEAMQQNAALMTKLMTTLGRAGIADKDIQTSSFNVRLERELHTPIPLPAPAPDAAVSEAAASAPASKPAKPAAPPKGQTNPPHPTPHAPPTSVPMIPAAPKAPASFYMVSNNVRISVRDVSKVGAIIDAAASAGANNIWGINFDLEKKDAIEGELREKAVADARRRAEALAKLENISLGPVLAVSELVSGQDSPPPMPYAAARDSAAGTPVEPGQITVQDQIKVVFAIKR